MKALARGEPIRSEHIRDLEIRRAELLEITAKREKAASNLALAENEQQYKAIAAVFEDLQRRQNTLETEIDALQERKSNRLDPQAEVAAALALPRRLTEFASDTQNVPAMGEVFRQVNVRLFLKFQLVQVGKRTLNKLSGGVVTFGSTPPPISIYEGPTGRREIKSPASSEDAGPCSPRTPLLPGPLDPGQEGDSLGNVRRGDKTPLELFVAGIRGWEAGLRRQLDAGKSNQD